MKPDDATMQEIAGMLEGTCLSIERVLDQLNLDDKGFDVGDIEDALVDLNIERCEKCDWWMESCELVNADGDVVGCDDCREPEEE